MPPEPFGREERVVVGTTAQQPHSARSRASGVMRRTVRACPVLVGLTPPCPSAAFSIKSVRSRTSPQRRACASWGRRPA